jgi:hypothetical protein
MSTFFPHQPLPAFRGPNPVSPTGSAPSAGDGLITELLLGLPALPAYASNFQSFLGQIVALARMLTGATGSAIAFRGKQGTICRATAGQGAPPVGAVVDTSSGLSKQCLDSGRSLLCPDIATDGRVDPEISRILGVRAVAIVPIYNDGAVCGIVEVFSSIPGVFTRQHVAKLEHLAWLIGSAAMKDDEPVWASTVDVQLTDVRSQESSGAAFPQTDGWKHVFIDSPVPWKQFVGSVFLHVVVLGMFAGLSRIWPREPIFYSQPIREAHVIYYPFSQSYPARKSSPPPVRNRRQPPAYQEVAKAGLTRQPTLSSRNAGTKETPEPQALTAPPSIVGSRLRQSGLAVATSVLPPPPDINEARAAQRRLPGVSVVAPPPDIAGGPALRTISPARGSVVPPSPDVRGSITTAGLIHANQRSRGTAGSAEIPIVPPPPSVTDHPALAYGATGVVSTGGVQVVAPPPALEGELKLAGRGSTASLGTGGSRVVPPPPSVGNSVGGGRTTLLGRGGSQVVPPAPSIEVGGNSVGSGRATLLGRGGSQIVPPPPSIGGTGNSLGGGRGNAVANAGSEALPPASAGRGGNSLAGGGSASLAHAGGTGSARTGSLNGGANSGSSGDTVAKDIAVPPAPQVDGNRTHPIFQDVQLRVIGLAMALPTSSYFSNYEVFIAEKWLGKNESQLVKLVYMFLPYQRRLSEYGIDSAKTRKLRVTRDPTCDESLIQMTWPEGEPSPANAHHAGEALAANPANRKDLLPCYRTTADDYRRAVSHRR